MAVCLTFFPPSVKFQPYLEGYIKKHQSSSLDPPDVSVNNLCMNEIQYYNFLRILIFKSPAFKIPIFISSV